MYKNKYVMYNKYLLFGAYWSNDEVEMTGSSEATKTKKLYNGISLVGAL